MIFEKWDMPWKLTIRRTESNEVFDYYKSTTEYLAFDDEKYEVVARIETKPAPFNPQMKLDNL